ncbi:hypothetical protein HD806DRAFT_532191 [Xylariaceae sp. AK1471]|nr:hypothetical protein HD806DRAFT_532191 [Xylariaceae sp. AK1471]
MSLNRVPNEVQKEIVHWAMALGSKAAQLATVNSEWQLIVEEKTFRRLCLNNYELVPAMSILRARPERFDLVRVILFKVVLPPYDNLPYCIVVETTDEKTANDWIFTIKMRNLLTQLNEWPSTGKELELQLAVFSPSDAIYLKGNKWYLSVLGSYMQGTTLNRRFFGSTLEMYKDKLIENYSTPAVTKLTLHHGCDRYIAPSGVEGMFKALKNLKVVDIRLYDMYRHDFDVVRILDRRRMADALKIMPISVEIMKLSIKHSPPANQNCAGQKLCGSGQGDPLTIAFRNASQKMKAVDVYGMLGTPELFWPARISEANSAPKWPELKRMVVDYHILNPFGEWLFSKNSEPVRRQGKQPFLNLYANYTAQEDEEKMSAIYSAVCKAIGQMPKLEYLRLEALFFGYYGNTRPSHVFEFMIKDRVAHATWTGEPPYRPCEDSANAWKRMAYERDLTIQFEWTETKITLRK